MASRSPELEAGSGVLSALRAGFALFVGCGVSSCTGPAWSEPANAATPQGEAVFYRPRSIGSESLADPLSSNLQYALDNLQVRRSFGTDHFSSNLGDVAEHLSQPFHTIEKNGGWKEFVNSEILPIDPDHFEDSLAILPNVGLHLFGGGVLYRKNAEWFEAHGVSTPYLLSGVVSMAAELVGEATEKPTTVDTDEIADFWLFRPLGMWLFHDDARARWFEENLDPAVWAHLLMADVGAGEFANTGISYVVRPRWLGRSASLRPFAYFGITNLAGVSAALGGGSWLSAGFGASTVHIEPVETRLSGGLFLDHENSLLAALIVHGSEDLQWRFNAYPGTWLHARHRAGVFLGVTDDDEPVAGVQWGLPIGLALGR